MCIFRCTPQTFSISHDILGETAGWLPNILHASSKRLCIARIGREQCRRLFVANRKYAGKSCMKPFPRLWLGDCSKSLPRSFKLVVEDVRMVQKKTASQVYSLERKTHWWCTTIYCTDVKSWCSKGIAQSKGTPSRQCWNIKCLASKCLSSWKINNLAAFRCIELWTHSNMKPFVRVTQAGRILRSKLLSSGYTNLTWLVRWQDRENMLAMNVSVKLSSLTKGYSFTDIDMFYREEYSWGWFRLWD
jgi:hypothetical protein